MDHNHHHQCVWPHFEHTGPVSSVPDSYEDFHTSSNIEQTQPLLQTSDNSHGHHQCVWPHFEHSEHLLQPPPDMQVQHKKLEKCVSCPKGMDTGVNKHRSAKKSNSSENGVFLFKFKDKKSGWIRKRYTPSCSWPSEKR